MWARFFADAEGGARVLDSLLVWDLPHSLGGAPELLLLGATAGNEAGGGAAIWLDGHTGAELRSRSLPGRPSAVLDLAGGGAGHNADGADVPPEQATVASAGRLVVAVMDDGAAEIITRSGRLPPSWPAAARLIHFHSADSGAGIRGFGLRPNAAKPGAWRAQELWRLALGPADRLLTVAAHARGEAAHTRVRVLGLNRAVLFKYLNPNVLLLAAETPSTGTPPAVVGQEGASAPDTDLVVYLVDAVTGHVLHTTRHPGGRGPAAAVLVENWAVYSFWSGTAQRPQVHIFFFRVQVASSRLDLLRITSFFPTPASQVVSLELYDDAASKRAAGGTLAQAVLASLLPGGNSSLLASSLHPPAVRVLAQSFFLQQGVAQLAVTATARGITPRQLLVATPAGAIAALDRRMLDPRRPQTPTHADREEGLIPYADTIPVVNAGFATFHREVARLRGIVCAPSRLESTSLARCSFCLSVQAPLTMLTAYHAYADNLANRPSIAGYGVRA